MPARARLVGVSSGRYLPSPSRAGCTGTQVRSPERRRPVMHAVENSVRPPVEPSPVDAILRAEEISFVVRAVSRPTQADEHAPRFDVVFRFVHDGRRSGSPGFAQVENDICFLAVWPALHVQFRAFPVDTILRNDQAYREDDIRAFRREICDIPRLPQPVAWIDENSTEVHDPRAFPRGTDSVDGVTWPFRWLMKNPSQADCLLDRDVIKKHLRRMTTQ